jgi:hypothetical protein
MFGLNTEAAEELWNALKMGSLKDAKTILEEPSSKAIDETQEGKLLSATEEIRKDVSLIGAWFTGPKADIVDAITLLTNGMSGNKKFATSSLEITGILSDIGLSGKRQKDIDKVFKEAYNAQDQPDIDKSGSGDYAERAKKIQEIMEGIPQEGRYFMSMNPNNLIYTALERFKKPEDFTEENTRLAIQAIEVVRGEVMKKSGDELKGAYIEWAQDKIPENKLSSQDEVLQLLISGGSDKVLKKIMPLIDRYTDYGKEGNNINTLELNEMYRTLSQDKDMKDAMEWANSTTKRFNSIMQNIPSNGEGEEARKKLEDYRYMLPINELEGLLTEVQDAHSEGGTVITNNEMTKLLEGINNLISAVEKDKTTVVIEK